ncbi:MAG: glycosyltransferase family 4 protein, partial [Thermodesulfobacteriota bacterium]|nr:glycosyltransferase family 4 protein [Thermodesulfobacteriota bacterium]
LYKLNVSYLPIVSTPSTFTFFKAVFHAIVKGKYDLVHSHGFTAAICSILPSIISRSPHLFTSHDVFTRQQLQGIKGALKKMLFSFLLPFIDVIHSVSHDAEENFLEYLPSLRLIRWKLITIPNGIEVERFINNNRREFSKELKLPENVFLIGFLGRFMAQKGFKYLIGALELMNESTNLQKTPVILAFGGDAFVREEKEYVQQKGLQDSVYFLPFTPNIAAVLRGLDVVAIPSLWEACPLLPMEAMISGIPIIGTNCIGLREVLKQAPSVMVPIKDENALACALLKELRNPTTRLCKEFAPRAAILFDVKKQAIKIENVINSMLRKK